MENEAIVKMIGLDLFDTSLSVYRLLYPTQIKWMKQSLERMGQLQPVVARETEKGYQLIDGFKRYYASEQLAMEHLVCRVLQVSESVARP
jgi:ParB-like chromosome segregation protein Spo0J